MHERRPPWTLLWLILLAGASHGEPALELQQPSPPPVIATDLPATLVVRATGQCTSSGDAGSAAAMLGDTLSAWQPLNAQGAEFSFEVPARELGFARQLCARRDRERRSENIPLASAFTVQVFARCESADGHVREITDSLALAAIVDCPVDELPADDAETDAPQTPAGDNPAA